ncbi:hypothetical protein [Candidatus Protochlamydia amoebophila]|uniref:hypothetical protein n=1 Tax=Candidatus Protochlamydia amoebophila TaxID=362787 RepID=UPI0015EFC559|nr:hypothetical protein [Candidatus Protochlamydia amoebophila]
MTIPVANLLAVKQACAKASAKDVNGMATKPTIRELTEPNTNEWLTFAICFVKYAVKLKFSKFDSDALGIIKLPSKKFSSFLYKTCDMMI